MANLTLTDKLKDKCRISVLCDNITQNDTLGKEWGLSMAIELPQDALWLWDCGASLLFLKNAEKMGIQPEKAKGLALSHGHWDHTGGMNDLMDAHFMGPVFAHPDFARKRYSQNDDGTAKDASFPCDYPGTIIVRDHVELDEGLYMFTEIPRRDGLFEATEGLFIDPELTITDPVSDDAFLLLMSSSGPVVILGCCHSGLANSLYHLRDLTGLESVHAIIGGLHLFNSDEQEFEKTAKVIEEFSPAMISPGHCTGEDGFKFLKNRLTCEVLPMGSGATYQF
ncbi:MBL fold metallo-hydrolase [Maridesulfovibrio hydrothermalis]|uniref:Beta-lactamase domain protein n=1 Tax=Maridesulfovibrio hydrothermalis AM13 = DSM 14728 TaxID=1121451 RepID=L0RCP8_9BACT|nr:MBL fold metallo-hydrolase [Maridesulfovibrio hydrothermalis]CCO24524.1 Beta-lactamase domain protein [Maridesulfovibrio hydrothermalis AM13 = DSM 14728]